MAGEIFKEQQKQQTPIQATKEAEQLKVSPGEFKQQQKQAEELTEERERQMTQATANILRNVDVSNTDDSDPADPAMEFADEQQREWYDRKRAAMVEKNLGEGAPE